MMEVIERLKQIAAKSVSGITDDDKIFVRKQAEALNIEVNAKKNCKSCYIDAAVMIYKRLKEDGSQSEPTAAVWKLKKGVDVVWNGIRINAATITDEKAVQYLKSGFPRFYFE